MADSVRPTSRPRPKISADASLLVQNVRPNPSTAKKEYKGYGGYEKYARPKSRRQQYRDVRTPSLRNSRNPVNKQDSQTHLQSMQVQGVNPNSSKTSKADEPQDIPERPRTSRGHRQNDAPLESTGGMETTPRPTTSRGRRKENIAPGESDTIEDERPKTSRGRRQAGVSQSVNQAAQEQSDHWLENMKEGQAVGTGSNNTDKLEVWSSPADEQSVPPRNEESMQSMESEEPRPSSRRLRPKSAKGRSRPPCTQQDIAMWSSIREDRSGVPSPEVHMQMSPLSPQSSSLYHAPAQVSPRDSLLQHQTMTAHRPPSGSQQILPSKPNISPQHSMNLSDSQRLTYEWQQRQYQAAAAAQEGQGLGTPRQDSSMTKYAPLPAIGNKSSAQGQEITEKTEPSSQSKQETRKDKSESLGAQIRKKASQPYTNRQKHLGKGTPDSQSSSSKDNKNGNILQESTNNNRKKSPNAGVPATTKGKVSPAQNGKKGKSPDKIFKTLERQITLPDEPMDDPRIHLAVRLPSGTRVLRYFSLNDKLSTVLNFAEDAAKLDFSNCWLASTAPVVIHKDMSRPISETGLENRTVLHIQVPDT